MSLSVIFAGAAGGSAGAIVLVFMLPPPMLTQLVHIAEQQPPIGAVAAERTRCGPRPVARLPVTASSGGPVFLWKVRLLKTRPNMCNRHTYTNAPYNVAGITG